MSDLRQEIAAHCASIGSDPLLTQGAGGNVSWKDGDVMFVKASGTLLADALRHDIFVPMALAATRDAIGSGTEDFTPFRLPGHTLRPSIETSLHALMPQRIVVHVHAVEIIAKAVLRDAERVLSRTLEGVGWLWIPYAKPGVELTREIASRMCARAVAPSVLILGNHGLVVAGDSLEEISTKLDEVLNRCRTAPRFPDAPPGIPAETLATSRYKTPLSPRAHTLASDAFLPFCRDRWVMYPDHAVFLGGHAVIVDAAGFAAAAASRPPCIIVSGIGVAVPEEAPGGVEALLAVYPEVLARLPAGPDSVRALSDAQIAVLLDWDAEKYRQRMGCGS